MSAAAVEQGSKSLSKEVNVYVTFQKDRGRPDCRRCEPVIKDGLPPTLELF